MGIEKQGSKGGGSYVGGFRQLFDWNDKSRKKLFSSKSDLPEGSKQEKTSNENFLTTRLHLMQEDDNGCLSAQGSSSYSCSSSVTDDEGNGTKAPGVVARLMGLDSLPTSSITEPYSTPIFSSRSLREVHYRRNPEFCHEQKNIYSRNQLNKSDDFSGNAIDLKVRKMINKPIQRFQTEILPPKSAKSIPITHHKLLSPIKSPRLINSKNAAQIMEEAAKIIVLGSQASVKGKIPSAGSSLVPVKFQNVKKKIEAVQRPSSLPGSDQRSVESKAVKYLEGQSLTKSWKGVEDEHVFMVSPSVEESNSAGLKNNRKSISLAVQAKVNVQRREGLCSNSNRNLLSQKEHNELQSNQPFKNQPCVQRNIQKKSVNQNASGVLRQNNQKQNRLTNRDKKPSKPAVPKQQGKKTMSDGTSFAQNKTLKKVAGSSKVGSRKMDLDTTDVGKELGLPRVRNFTQKKRCMEGDFQLEKSNDLSVGKDTKPNQLNVSMDVNLKWEGDNKKKGMDVVSFTFTSPLVKSTPALSATDVAGKHNRICVDSCSENIPVDTRSMKSAIMGLNVIGGDALSILLEQKLWELTYDVESSCCKSVKSVSGGSSASIAQVLVSDLNALSTTPEKYDDMPQLKYNSTCCFNSSSSAGCMLEGAADLGDNSSKSVGRKELDCRHPSPISILEPSFSNESCDSSDSSDYICMNGANQCLSIQAQEVADLNCPVKLQSKDADMELSDSASSAFTEDIYIDHVKALNMASPMYLHNWELEYAREILCSAELLFEDFTLSQASQIVNPQVFDELESQKTWLISDSEENSSILRRKVLFDCVGECLDLRCRQYGCGGYKEWEKGAAMVNNGWLAEEVYKEISGWRIVIDDSMLDELVDKDMSSQYGRWLDFEIERFEVGVEIGRRILSSLVNELVKDMLAI